MAMAMPMPCRTDRHVLPLLVVAPPPGCFIKRIDKKKKMRRDDATLSRSKLRRRPKASGLLTSISVSVGRGGPLSVPLFHSLFPDTAGWWMLQCNAACEYLNSNFGSATTASLQSAVSAIPGPYRTTNVERAVPYSRRHVGVCT
jgi:hypothetical protein